MSAREWHASRKLIHSIDVYSSHGIHGRNLEQSNVMITFALLESALAAARSQGGSLVTHVRVHELLSTCVCAEKEERI